MYVGLINSKINLEMKCTKDIFDVICKKNYNIGAVIFSMINI